MNIEQLRADFEAWYEQEFEPLHGPLVRDEHNYEYSYENTDHALMWEAYQAGRAALQSQDRDCVAALRMALQALEAISVEMTVGDRFTNAGQYLLDALGPVREAIDHARRVEGES